MHTMPGMPFHRTSQRGAFKIATDNFSVFTPAKLSAKPGAVNATSFTSNCTRMKKLAGAHVIKLRCFKNFRAVRNKEAGPAMHDSWAVGTRNSENELGFHSVMRLRAS